MSKYGKLTQQEATALLFEKDVQIGHLTSKNDKLEVAQLAFQAELDKEFEKMKAMNGWQRFIKGFSIGFQIMKTYAEAQKTYLKPNKDLSIHLIK